MPWLLLIVAGLFEVGWAIGLKYTEGFSRPLPTVLTVLSMIVSLGLLGLVGGREDLVLLVQQIAAGEVQHRKASLAAALGVAHHVGVR